MSFSRATLLRQFRFNQRLMTRGRFLTFTFAAPYARDPASGAVFRAALGTKQGRGLLSLGGVTSDLKREKTEKWGQSFIPDGDLLFSSSLFSGAQTAQTLTTITDGNDPDGPVDYDVLYVTPSAFLEDVGRVCWVRRGPVYNKRVQVRIEDETNNISRILFTDLPCRLTPQESGLSQQEPDFGGVFTASLTLECPFVLTLTGDVGEGVEPLPAGLRPRLTPKRTVLIDDPAAYGEAGEPVKYRVEGIGMDAGGDGKLLRYPVSLA